MTGVPLPADPKADLGPTGLNAVVPAEFTADAVVVVTDRATGAPALVIIVVEPQGREDKTKAYSWPTYLPIVQEAVQCPSAVLLVVCPAPARPTSAARSSRWATPSWDPYPITLMLFRPGQGTCGSLPDAQKSVSVP